MQILFRCSAKTGHLEGDTPVQSVSLDVLAEKQDKDVFSGIPSGSVQLSNLSEKAFAGFTVGATYSAEFTPLS